MWLPRWTRSTPPGFDTTVRVGAIAEPLEGAARPGHFDGVATVVAILFALVGAEHAYFGQKDAQQVLVIERMATDLALPTRVVRCPTVREPDGLALSSRNVHLSPDERRAAPVLHRALDGGTGRPGKQASAMPRRSGAESATSWRASRSAGVEYVSCADARTLVELERIEGPALLSLAVRFGATRLIDNEWLEDDASAASASPNADRPDGLIASVTAVALRARRSRPLRTSVAERASPVAAAAARASSRSRSPSTSKWSATRRLISSIFAVSAGWVLTSRSWTSLATV